MSIQHVPSPWVLKGNVHILFTYLTSSNVKRISKSFLFSPLEGDSSFAEGKHLGGISTVQIIRYTESPVGPYDELIIGPGKYEYKKPVTGGALGEDGRPSTSKEKNMMITRIYVSSKESTFNGRYNWNVPKHLARFEFVDSPDGSMTVSVFPSDVNSTAPFFFTTFKPVSWIPSFSASTSLAKYVGIDLTQVQAPLPKGDSEELVGTDKWVAVDAVIMSKKCSLGAFDLKAIQSGVEKESWANMKLWSIGLRMDDATITFGEKESWLQF